MCIHVTFSKRAHLSRVKSECESEVMKSVVDDTMKSAECDEKCERVESVHWGWGASPWGSVCRDIGSTSSLRALKRKKELKFPQEKLKKAHQYNKNSLDFLLFL